MNNINVPKYHDALEEQLFEDMEQALKPYGFFRTVQPDLLSTVEKLYDFGRDYVSKTHIMLLYSLNKMSVLPYSLSRKIKLIDDLWTDLGHLANISPVNSNLTLFITAESAYPDIRKQSFYNPNSQRCELSLDKADIKKFNEFSRFVMIEKILPLAELYQNLTNLDTFVNETVEFGGDKAGLLAGGNVAIFRRLVIARLVDNHRFDDIYNHYKQMADNYLKSLATEPDEATKNYIIAFDRLYERLRNIKPLMNPILT